MSMGSDPFLHTHPYEPFLFPEATKLIVGTLPPPRFTTGELREKDVDFCYGSCNGMLWPILDRIFGLGLIYENCKEAVAQRKNFLVSQGLGVCDIVESAQREKVDASDLGMQQVILRDLVGLLLEYEKIDTLLFMGGNSKNGPEYFFRKQLKERGLELQVVSTEVPRIHRLELSDPSDPKGEPRLIRTVSLTAPSGAANRAVGSIRTYKELKARDPNFSTLDFRVSQYQAFFQN